MSLDFKLHYDRLRENDPTKPEAAAEADAVESFYDSPSHARNLCLVWPDGKRQFLNYSYLVGGTFTPGDEGNEIRLTFSDGALILRGYGLEALFASLIECLPKQLVVADKRYALSIADNSVVVTEATFQKQS